MVSQLVKVVQRVVGARRQVNGAAVAITAAVASGDASGVGVAW